ncbi:MAG: hypothetical protein ACTSWX_01950 [Promethearchaeota archaeon]
MYIAELKGKLSPPIEHMEDILTSNIFSFFKYADRRIFLKTFLEVLGIYIKEDEAERAEFLFWPCYEDGTEPDVVIVVGDHYLLFEAKYHSDFGENQLMREVDGGKLAAKNKGKQFHLIAITADYSEPKWKFSRIYESVNFRWINWQQITNFLEIKLKSEIPDREFVEDLYALLKKKNLRLFDGFFNIFRKKPYALSRFIFFDYISSIHRGEFIGFLEVFANWRKIIKRHKTLFFIRSGNFTG